MPLLQYKVTISVEELRYFDAAPGLTSILGLSKGKKLIHNLFCSSACSYCKRFQPNNTVLYQLHIIGNFIMHNFFKNIFSISVSGQSIN
jgi:hypothetical protein